MKGIILAGGSGSRLDPLTISLNKHMLPVGKYPMIYYPLNTMIENGITDILIVTGNSEAGQFVNLLGDGSSFGVNIFYSYQKSPLGIADALNRGREFIGDNSEFLTILGDNIFTEKLNVYQKITDLAPYSKIFLKEVRHPEHYGVACFNDDGELTHIEEKPKDPKSNRIATGAYVYPGLVFDYINNLKPSARGELEITDLNNLFIKQGIMEYQYLENDWYDCGESLKEYNETSYKMRNITLKI
jgi:glucose-1-phosphate thymidylyltransferase